MRRPNLFPNSASTRFSFALVAVVAALFAGPDRTQPVARAQTSTSSILLQPGNLVYEGAFCLPATGPSGLSSPNSFHDGAEAMAFDPYTNSLVVQGNFRYGNAARVTIPTPSTSSCPRGTLQGAWLDMMWRFPNNNPDADDRRIGGFLPQANGDLIISAYVYYDANATQRVSHVRRSASGSVSAWTQVGTGSTSGISYPAGFVSGWMLPVPTDWQSLLGAPALTGNGSLSIISRTSLGPALATFDPAKVPSGTAIASTQVLAYPISNPTLGTCETGTTFNCSASNNRAGMVWPDGTRTILYAHHVCPVPPTYSGGWHCSVGRVTRWLAYDANELVAAKNGQKAPWEIVPYGIWDPGAPLSDKPVVSIAHDPSTKRIFVAERWGDGAQPKIHVYSVNGTVTSSVPLPPPPSSPTDTSAPSVTITAPVSGTVVTGSIAIGASASDNVGVAGVQFTLDGANLGGEDTSSPYQAAWDTTNTGNGSHTLRAIARDAVGNTSSSAVTVSVNNVSLQTDTTAPTVSLVTPAEDTTTSGTMTLAATASDNIGVTAVQFTLNDVSIGEPVAAPYQWSWTTTSVPDGTYTVKAVARDAAGNSRQSEGHRVTVANLQAGGGDALADGSTEGGDTLIRRGGDKSQGGRAKGRNDNPRTTSAETASDPELVPLRALAGTEATRPSEDPSPAGGGRRSLAGKTGSKAAARTRTAASPAGGTGGESLSPATPAVECQGTNPFESRAGQIGICANGQWTLVQGIRTWGKVRQRTLPTGGPIWVVETDEALYDVSGGVADHLRQEGLEVVFEGWFRTDLKSALEGALMIEIRQMTLPEKQ